MYFLFKLILPNPMEHPLLKKYITSNPYIYDDNVLFD